MQSSADSGMLLSMEDMQMTINDLYNMDEVTVLFDTDPLTGEQAEAEQEWTADHERELTALDWAKKNKINSWLSDQNQVDFFQLWDQRQEPI